MSITHSLFPLNLFPSYSFLFISQVKTCEPAIWQNTHIWTDSRELAAQRCFRQQRCHPGDSWPVWNGGNRNSGPFSSRGILLAMLLTDLQGLIYRMGDQCENIVKLLKLGRYLDYLTHGYHSCIVVKRRRKQLDYKLEKPSRKTPSAPNSIFYDPSSKSWAVL